MSKTMKNNKQAPAPRLRFPEFLDTGEWKFTPLKRLAKRCTEKNQGGKLIRVLTNSAEHGVIDQRDYFDKDIAVQGNLEGYFIVKEGDFVYNPRISSMAPVGPISKNNIATGVMSPLYTVFRFTTESDVFYAQYFKTTGWHQYMRHVSSTGARHDRMAISKDDFLSMPLPTSPTEKEKQKIADCLSSLDALIASQVKKIDALKIHKRGLMQLLFPQSGETTPRMRFPEFQGEGDWIEKPLGEVGQIITGKTPSTKNADLWGEGIPFITPTDIFEDHKYQWDTARKVLKTKEIKTIPEGSIVYTCIASIGKMALTTCESTTNQQINSIIVHRNISNEFIFYTLDNLTPWIKLTPASSTLAIINKTDFSDIPIKLPNSADEQKKISNCLSAIDFLIEAQTGKRDALRVHKKGLMQQLFPFVKTDFMDAESSAMWDAEAEVEV